MKVKQVEINELKPGDLFHYTDTWFEPARVYYMRKMKRKPAPTAYTGRPGIPIQVYGFTQGRVFRFSMKKPSHWCVDGRYKAIKKTKKNWKPKKDLLEV